ncbi:MAG: glycoside hydrolase family 5 protein [Myxococcota bacterium]
MWFLLACTASVAPPFDARPLPARPRPVAEHGALAVRDGRLVDERGNPVQLRGVSTQWLNWERTYATNRAGLAWLRDDWGLSVLRLANGVEHATGYARDVENRHAIVEQIIDNAIAEDVYVLVDWHTHQFRVDEAKAFFTRVARRYGHHPHVLYEVFNEPGPLADWQNDLLPYHEAVVTAIRAEDPDNVIVLGSPEFSSRPDLAIEHPVSGDNLAYTMHFYACSHGAEVRAHGQAALDAGLALFATEWASSTFDGGAVFRWGCPEATREWVDWLDGHQISWAAWKLSSDFDRSGMLAPRAAPSGGWGAADLKGHGPLIRTLLREGVTREASRAP